jgi:hypothetical protein
MAETSKISLDIVFDEMQQQRKLQLKNINSLDTKAGILIGFESLLFVNLLFRDFNNLLFVIGFIVLIASLFCLIVGIQLKSYKFNPHPNVLINDYIFRQPSPDNGETKPSSKEQILVDQHSAYIQNESAAKQKAFWVKVALWLLLLSVFLLGSHKLGGVKMSDDTASSASQEQTAKPNPAADNSFEKSIKPSETKTK